MTERRERRGGPRWRKSTRSGSTGGQCVEVAAAGDGLVRIRDSKDPGGPRIVVTTRTWQRSLPRFHAMAPAAGLGPAGGEGQRTATGREGGLAASWEGGLVALRDAGRPDGPVLRFTAAEWEAFLAGAADGEFAVGSGGFTATVLGRGWLACCAVPGGPLTVPARPHRYGRCMPPPDSRPARHLPARWHASPVAPSALAAGWL